MVRSSKSLSANREELQFLQSLQERLSEAGDADGARRELESRIAALEYGHQSPPASEAPCSPPQGFTNKNVVENHESPATNIGLDSMQSHEMMAGLHDLSSPADPADQAVQPTGAATVKCLESLAWGRNAGACYPHRRCNCTRYRKYSELASINCDLASPTLQWAPVNIDSAILLSAQDDRKLITFHLEHLWWHHNALHSPTFLEQCEIFWSLGTAVHPLWAALYLSITCVCLFPRPRLAEDVCEFSTMLITSDDVMVPCK